MDDLDAVTANGVKVVQKEVHVPHGVIVVLEDFLFMEQYNGPPDEDSMTPIPMITSADSDFPMIELGTHNLHDKYLSRILQFFQFFQFFPFKFQFKLEFKLEFN